MRYCVIHKFILSCCRFISCRASVRLVKTKKLHLAIFLTNTQSELKINKLCGISLHLCILRHCCYVFHYSSIYKKNILPNAKLTNGPFLYHLSRKSSTFICKTDSHCFSKQNMKLFYRENDQIIFIIIFVLIQQSVL